MNREETMELISEELIKLNQKVDRLASDMSVLTRFILGASKTELVHMEDWTKDNE